jgi:adenine/guanine phosphoribosyltransferase-like PRPP-binding protein
MMSNFKILEESFLIAQGGHTVDGAEYWNYTFNEQDAFTPIVEVTGVNFLPVGKETVEFDTVVTPEFSGVAIAVIMASILGAVTLYMRKGTIDYRSP